MMPSSWLPRTASRFLDGSRVDFVKDGLKQMFAFENPNVDNTCGCGESFSLKEATKATSK